MRDLVADRDGVMVDDAVLVVDELVSNAYRHAAAPRACRLALLDRGRRLRVEVDDASSDPPRMRTPDRSGGRGLVLVARLAAAWGVQHYRDHKTVWAELTVQGAGTGGHARHLATARRSDQPPRTVQPEWVMSSWHGDPPVLR